MNKLGGPCFQTIMRAFAKHLDAVDVHCYEAAPCAGQLHHIHNLTRLPVLMSEFGFRARDSGLPNTKGAGPLLWTQTERATMYLSYVRQLVALPFVVGYHMFMWHLLSTRTVEHPALG
jgi:hypothetical protein